MPPPSDQDIADAILRALKSPSKVEVDGRAVTQRPLNELTDFINWNLAPTATADNVLNISQSASGRSPLD